MPLGVIDLLEFSVIPNSLNSVLGGNDFVITSHYHHRSELKSLSQMHCADGNVAANNIYIAIE